MSKHNILLFDLDLWPTTLTYNPSLAKVKVNFYTKNPGHRSNSSAMRVPTHTQMEWRLQFYKQFYDQETTRGHIEGENFAEYQ